MHGAALLLLADGRLPAGGYAHSGGLEATVRIQGLTNAADLDAFLEGRAATVGFAGACFAVAAHRAAGEKNAVLIHKLDRAMDARTPSQAARAASRALGRQLLRTAATISPHPVFDLLGATMHQPVVYGAAALALGMSAREAAQVVLHESVAGPAAAAVKVLNTDPFAVHAVLVRLTGFLDELADQAIGYANVAPDQLPAPGAPLLDIAAEHHCAAGVRLFGS
jgi:urease accessory protein